MSNEEKEERLLSRLRAEAERVAAAGDRWAEAEAQLRGELEERGSKLLTLEDKLARQQTQLHTQNGWIVSPKGELAEARSANSVKAAKITQIENQIARHSRELQSAVDESQSRLVGTFKLLGEMPGCWVLLAVAVNVAWFLIWLFSSIISSLTHWWDSLWR